jgi:hypothetical protein
VLRLDTHKFLGTEAFLEFLPDWRTKQRRATAPANGAGVVAAPSPDVAAERLEAARRFVREQLDDPALSDEDKARVRSRWRSAHPGVEPPWEGAEA